MIAADKILDEAGIPRPGPADVHRGQARFAYRLADSHRNRLMHVDGMGWHAWDGSRWRLDKKEPTRAVLEEIQRAVLSSPNDVGLQRDARKCESQSGVQGILALASALNDLSATVADLDSDPYLLNTVSGTLDLRTMELRPSAPSDRITKVTRGAYREHGTGEAWADFLGRVLPDPESRAFLQRVAGVGLLGTVKEQILTILTGTGANGKGVFYGALGHALGDYASIAEPDLFMQREGAHPTGEMDLRGIRWVVVSESNRGRRIDEANMKRLTGGDEIKARHMRKDFVRFTPSHTPLLVTNHLPKVSGDDPALWRRIRVIPFDVVIPAHERDPHLAERLQREADAVLTWAIAGWTSYAAGGLSAPRSVMGATDAYQYESDAVSRFVEARCIRESTASLTTSEAHDQWTRWAIHDGADPLTLRAFGQALDRLGFPAKKGTAGRRMRSGLGLRNDDDRRRVA